MLMSAPSTLPSHPSTRSKPLFFLNSSVHPSSSSTTLLSTATATSSLSLSPSPTPPTHSLIHSFTHSLTHSPNLPGPPLLPALHSSSEPQSGSHSPIGRRHQKEKRS